jgi:hypothetical protein
MESESKASGEDEHEHDWQARQCALTGLDAFSKLEATSE